MADLNTPDVATLRARQSVRLLATPKRAESRPFSASRWPYTYAYDHVRSRVSDVDSRAEAAGYVKRLAEQASLPREFVCELLATAYCQEWNIDNAPYRRGLV